MLLCLLVGTVLTITASAVLALSRVERGTIDQANAFDRGPRAGLDSP